ncbi:MAG: cysteine--tRNA ligase [Alphaproteobacteria bacterium]
MTLTLYNTLTKAKAPFTPIDARNVRLYACGITPYDYGHMGNAATAVAFDMLFRVLRHVYGEGHVTYVRNVTDIDDKIITRAAETGQTPVELSAKFSAIYEDSLNQLGCLPPTQLTLVSTHLPEIVAMVDALIDTGFAYATPSGDVMYRVSKFPAYGALVNRKLEDQQHGSRVAEDTEKESPDDFVLWKANAKSATKMEQAFNPAEYGAKHFAALGRPGWHIECSAMSKKHLGDTFDIHGGGEDLKFPHHSCEIAQSEALLPHGQPMANVWMHRAFITVEGRRMGKSMGNFVSMPDALAKHDPMAIRLWLLQTHYRKPVDYSEQALEACATRLTKLRRKAAEHGGTEAPPEGFMNALLDDLNTSKALSFLEANPASLSSMMGMLGLK